MSSRNYKLLLVIVLVVFVFSSVLFLCIYHRGSSVGSRVVVDVGDVRDAERIATTLLDKYWSKSDRLWVYSFDIFWSRKDIQIQYDRYSLNYTYEFKRFVLNKIIYQIALNTELYFRGTKHLWDNRTWIQYDRINKRLFIYHNGYFTGDDPRGMGSINAIFYLD